VTTVLAGVGRVEAMRARSGSRRACCRSLQHGVCAVLALKTLDRGTAGFCGDKVLQSTKRLFASTVTSVGRSSPRAALACRRSGLGQHLQAVLARTRGADSLAASTRHGGRRPSRGAAL